MRVVFVNRYFHPDHSASSQLLAELAFHLAATGWDVGVITSRQRYDDPRASLPAHEVVRGVAVRRIWSSRFGRRWLPLRAIDYLTFYGTAAFAMIRERRSIVVALTDPPLISIVAACLGTRVVNWTQDLFPEVAIALGLRAPRFLAALRDWSFRRARVNVAIGELMAARMTGRTVVRHNWAPSVIHPEPRASGVPFTVAYSGNLGRAHEFDAIAQAMRALPDVRFTITGGGARLESLRKGAPSNVEFRDYQPIEHLSKSLGEGDAHLVTLQPALEGMIVPSKFYGILAAGRAVIHVGDVNGELGRIIRASGCGFAVSPDAPAELIDAIRRLERDRALCSEMGAKARRLYDDHYSTALALQAWSGILGSVAHE